MPTETNAVLNLAKSEGKFRLQIIGYLGAVLKSDIPVSVKSFVLTILFLFVLFSFQTCIMILHCAFSLLRPSATMNFMPYFYGISGEGVLGVAIAIPLITRMTSLEGVQRLEGKLSTIQQNKEKRHKGEDG
jgi:hypothetical protein